MRAALRLCASPSRALGRSHQQPTPTLVEKEGLRTLAATLIILSLIQMHGRAPAIRSCALEEHVAVMSGGISRISSRVGAEFHLVSHYLRGISESDQPYNGLRRCLPWLRHTAGCIIGSEQNRHLTPS